MAIGNKTKIFEYLYENQNNSYNVNQISRLLGISVGSAFKILKEFENKSCVKANKKNNAILYQINLNSKTRDMHYRIYLEKNKSEKKKTKVIATMGPVSNNAAIIKKMIENGVNVIRFNASYCSKKFALSIIKNVREASKNIPIMIEIPGSKINKGIISDIDKNWINFALKNDIDFVSVPSIRNSEDVRKINKLLGYSNIKQVIGEKIKVIAKIGTKEALKNYREVIQEAYGIIIDRGNLALETKYEVIPRLQKKIINECNNHGKPVIIATQLLNSMVHENQPTKAEVSDISNAVLEGASCLMLSSETASGKYPLEAVEAMSKIIKSIESEQIEKKEEIFDVDFTYSIGKAILEVDKLVHIDAVIILTSGGYSARMISSNKLRPKIIAATSSKKIFRQLNILWGIQPLFVNCSLEDISNEEKKGAILHALKKGFIKKRDQIAIIASVFHSKSKRTNLLEIHKVNEFLDYLNKKTKVVKNALL